MKVAEGIDTVDALWVGNTFLVRSADGLLLVDSGTPGSAKRILASIERIGATPSELRCIVLTLSGDALFGDRHGRLRQPDRGLSLDPDQASVSAAALRSLEPRLLLPGHGAPVRG